MKTKRASGVSNNKPGTFDNYCMTVAYNVIIFTTMCEQRERQKPSISSKSDLPEIL